MSGYSHSGSGLFSSNSETSEQFFFELLQKNYSLSLQANFLLSYTLSILPPYATTVEFQIEVASLPATYAGNEAAYQQFIDAYGTDVITASTMGGQLVAKVFFESCFLASESKQYVASSSSSSIFGIAGDTSGGVYKNDSTSEQFKQWSDVSISLLGGNGSAYGVLAWNNTIAPSELAAWKASIYSTPQPVTFTVEPIYSFITDAAIAANVKQALAAYGSSINAANEDLVEKIMAQHPMPPQPSWCHLDAAHGPAASTLHDLPLCPPVPTPPSALLATRARRAS